MLIEVESLWLTEVEVDCDPLIDWLLLIEVESLWLTEVEVLWLALIDWLLLIDVESLWLTEVLVDCEALIDWLLLIEVESLWLTEVLVDCEALIDWLLLIEVESLWLTEVEVDCDPLIDWLLLIEVESLWLTEVEVLWLVEICVLSNNEWLTLLDAISEFSSERLVDFERLSEVSRVDLLLELLVDKLKLLLLLRLFSIESLLCPLCFSETLVNSLLCLSYSVCCFSKSLIEKYDLPLIVVELLASIFKSSSTCPK